MRCAWLFAGMTLVAFTVGCGQPPATDDGPQADGGQEDGPDVAVHRFLEAVRTGNDAAAAEMLTPVARAKTAEYNMVVAPPGSDTAAFKVGEVEMVGTDGAHVASFWTDLDENGQKHTDTIIWMVRKEAQGWCIAGMATRVFDDKPPMILNFEQPEDMLAKQGQAEEEMSRRQSEETSAPDTAEAADSRGNDKNPPTERR